MKHTLSKDSRPAFTIIELILTVGIIALLSAIAIPGYMAARKTAQLTSVVSELRVTTEAISLYATEHHE